MRKRNQPRQIQRREKKDEPLAWRYYLMASVCCGILVAGFFFAARQHFSSIDYGIKNSRLRKQLDELESEKRRLLVAKEISLTPAELRKAAKRVGFYEMASARSEQASPAASVSKAVEAVSATPKASPGNKVVPIVMSVPVAQSITSPKQAKNTTSKDKKS